jgi:hypothetical protein
VGPTGISLGAALALHVAAWYALGRVSWRVERRGGGVVELEVVEPRRVASGSRSENRFENAANKSVKVATSDGRQRRNVGPAKSREAHVETGIETETGTGTGTGAGTAAEPPTGKPDLFVASALGRAVGVDLDAPAPAGFRPRRGVGGGDGRGGVDVYAFLAEDAARQRVVEGAVPPRLREIERRLEKTFAPAFAHVEVGNRRELLHKQFMARLRTPPEVRPLPRGEDPTRETNQEKLKRIVAQPFFLGRRAEVFARQRADGTLVEIALRSGSGYRAFDDEALDAVEKALAGRPPAAEDVRAGEVRTLWRLEATGYVVYAATPSAVFDEASGKTEWVYPLEKRIDRKVQLMAIY